MVEDGPGYMVMMVPRGPIPERVCQGIAFWGWVERLVYRVWIGEGFPKRLARWMARRGHTWAPWYRKVVVPTGLDEE